MDNVAEKKAIIEETPKALSPEDSEIMRNIIQRLNQMMLEYTQMRMNFLAAEKNFRKTEQAFQDQERKAMEILRLLSQEQAVTLKQIGQRMKIPETYLLDTTTMSWVPRAVAENNSK